MVAALASAPTSPWTAPTATGSWAGRRSGSSERARRPVGQGARAAEAYRRFGPLVYRRCLRLLRHPEAARDATQEVFVKLVGSLDRFEGGAAVLPWLYRVASNHCLNLRRAARHRGEDQPEVELDLLAAAPGPAHPDLALARQVLERFDETTRLVAVAVLVDGMEHEEVAEVLGLSRRSVARKLERFLDGARRFLVIEGVGEQGGVGPTA